MNSSTYTSPTSPYPIIACPDSPYYESSVPSANQKQFIKKLMEILSDITNSHLISWNQNGKSFIVKDTKAFSEEVLPKYFKSCNFNSFVRQLNMYNFHKVRNTTSAGDNESCEFENEYFIRNKPQLLCNIKRKSNEKDTDIKAQFAELRNKYFELFCYFKELQEEFQNLKIYYDRKIGLIVRNLNNNNINFSSPLNEITTMNGMNNMNGINNMNSMNIVNNVNEMSNMNNVAIPVIINTTEDESYNYLDSNNLNPINNNINPNTGATDDYRYSRLGANEFNCLSPSTTSTILSDDFGTNQCNGIY